MAEKSKSMKEVGPILEVCVDSLASAMAAQEGGAHRIELCSSLLEGGLTPGAGTIALSRQLLSLAINVMIRPRGGDFLFSNIEFKVMQHDIEVAKQLGADGVVVGILTPAGDVDLARTAKLVELARPLSVTFHRAFDLVSDPHAALDTLIELGVDRVLTSGLATSVEEGLPTIINLISEAAGRIIVMPGGGISEHNIAKIASLTDANEFHMSGRVVVSSQMQFQPPAINLGAQPLSDPFSQQVTSAQRIRASIDALQQFSTQS